MPITDTAFHAAAWLITLAIGLPPLAFTWWRTRRPAQSEFRSRAILCLIIASIATPVVAIEDFGGATDRMEPDSPKLEPKLSGVKPPPRPPRNTAVGLGPEDDHSDKKLPVTVTKVAEGEGGFVRDSGGVFHHGHVILRVEPNGRGEGSIISSEVSDSAIPTRYIKAVTETIREALGYGYEDRAVTDVIVRIVGGSWDEHASSELAFRMASIFAVKDAIKKARPVTLK